MNKFIKKVSRVKSITEANLLEESGANLIGVCLSNNFKFDDERIVTEETALSISKVLKEAKIFGELCIDDETNYIIKLVKRLNLDYVQPIGQSIPSSELREALAEENVGIIYSNIEVSHNEDPSWILSRYSDEKNLNLSFFQIDLLPEYKYSWQFLTEESPEYPEEIQIDDIDELGKENPLLLTLDFNPNNVLDILRRISSIKGIGMEIGNSPKRNDFHHFNYSEATEVLEKLQEESVILNTQL